MTNAPMLIGGVSTDDVLRRFEQCACLNGYKVEEWLTPAVNGLGLRIAATMRIKGQKHGLGFKWDGDDLNELAQRVMALDYSMTKLPEMVAKGKGAPWVEVH